MIYNRTATFVDTVIKMLMNQDEYSKILKFIDTTYPEIKRDILKNDILTCTGCDLFVCNHTPFTGNINSEIMFVGEAPGEQEERQGIPFVGPAGQLFNNMLAAAAEKIHPRWARDNVYITNTVKCRPTNGNKNRQPSVKEIASCRHFLDKEIQLVKPKIIICVGSVAAETLIHPNFKITEEHGKIFGDDIKLMAIYHPSYILHKGENTPQGVELKVQMWEDIKKANDYLENLRNQEG